MSKKKIKYKNSKNYVPYAKRNVHGLDAAIIKYSPIANEYGFVYKEMLNKNFVSFTNDLFRIDIYFNSDTVCTHFTKEKKPSIYNYHVSDEEIVEIFKNPTFKVESYHVRGERKETIKRDKVIFDNFLRKEVMSLYEKNKSDLTKQNLDRAVDFIIKLKSPKPVECIYMIRNTETEHIYIGSTNDFVRRKAMHLFTLKFGFHHNKNLQADYDNFGADKFSFEIMHEPKKDKDYNRDSLYLLEQIWIDKYNPEYNIQKIVQKFNN